MKKRILILLICFIVAIKYPSNMINASNRVVCNVQIISEQSAIISLDWSNNESKVPIRIISWNIVEDDILKITYESGEKVIEGWNKRTIQGNKYKFPMKIILEERNTNNILLTDLPDNKETKYSILNLYYRGIISGYEDGSFKPLNNVTRAEFAKLIVETANYERNTIIQSTFEDLEDKHWAKDYIMTLAKKGILKGRTNGNFDPNGNITIGEALAVINRTFILYDTSGVYLNSLTDHWSNDDFLMMVKGRVVIQSDNFYNPYLANKKATREECAILLSRVLEKLHGKK